MFKQWKKTVKAASRDPEKPELPPFSMASDRVLSVKVFLFEE